MASSRNEIINEMVSEIAFHSDLINVFTELKERDDIDQIQLKSDIEDQSSFIATSIDMANALLINKGLKPIL